MLMQLPREYIRPIGMWCMGAVAQEIVSIHQLDLILPDLPTGSAMQHPDELDGHKHSPGMSNISTDT